MVIRESGMRKWAHQPEQKDLRASISSCSVSIERRKENKLTFCFSQEKTLLIERWIYKKTLFSKTILPRLLPFAATESCLVTSENSFMKD